MNGPLPNTKPFYINFRKCIIADLKASARIKETGLSSILFEVIKYSFSGEPHTPPAHTRQFLEKLISPDHAICFIKKRGKNVLFVQAWPSWLNKGFRGHVSIFEKLFYSDDAPTSTCSRCSLCKKTFESSIMVHALLECKKLNMIDENGQWQAFTSLLKLGKQGLALYTCFPLLCQKYDRIIEQI
jgi:hypothetical protein